MKRFGTIAGRLGAFLAALLLTAGIAPTALAVPERPANKYVLDSAGVLTDATERKIIAKNEDLFEEHGAEIVVVAVDFLGGESIEDYTYDLFNDWGIGSAERNNGLLLVLAIGEDNYYAQAGYGIDDYFDAELLGDLLYDYLEDDFADGDYDAGVENVFDALADEVEDYYANDDHSDLYDDVEEYEEDWGSGGWSFFYVIRTIVTFIARIAIILLIVWVVVGFLSSWFGGGRGSGGGGGGGGFWRGMMLGSMMNRRRTYWGAPPPPPPPGPRPGGFGGPPRGGFGGFGGFGGGGGSHGGGAGRSGGFGGGHSGGGFHGGGGSHGGGAGRR